MKYIIIFITAPSKKEAKRIAGYLLKHKLAACVNILPCDSIFRWKKKIESAKELLLIAKSTKKKLNRIIKAVKSLHSYEIPEIIAIPVIGGFKSYLGWITEETKLAP